MVVETSEDCRWLWLLECSVTMQVMSFRWGPNSVKMVWKMLRNRDTFPGSSLFGKGSRQDRLCIPRIILDIIAQYIPEISIRDFAVLSTKYFVLNTVGHLTRGLNSAFF
jgi:hypothetical protein